MPFQVHNNSDGKKTIELAIEFPDGPWPARLSADRVVVGARKAAHGASTIPVRSSSTVTFVRLAVPLFVTVIL